MNNHATKTLTIEELKNMIIPILKEYPVDKAILFGSYARGNAHVNSDIDIYVDTNGKLKGIDFVGLLELLIDKVGIDIDLIDRNHIDLDSPIIEQIENEGMLLYEK